MVLNPFDVVDKIQDKFVFFFDKFGNFIDTIVIMFHHLYFWVVVLLYFLLLISLVWVFNKVRDPIKKTIRTIKNFVDKFKI